MSTKAHGCCFQRKLFSTSSPGNPTKKQFGAVLLLLLHIGLISTLNLQFIGRVFLVKALVKIRI